MTFPHAVIIVTVGFIAGMVNTIVGSGTLLTFPTLLALGYHAVIANVSNTIGLITGYLTGAIGYRRELKGQMRRILVLLPGAIAGTIIGAILLLALPGSAFRHVVPFLILLAVVLVVAQPRIAKWRAERGGIREHPGVLLQSGTFLTSIYGGYFGAAQSVILLGLFGITIDDDLRRLNAAKTVVSGVISTAAAIFFICTTTIAWQVVGLMVIGSTVGGQVGAVIGRRLSPQVLRATIAVVGTVAAIKLLVTG